jgi:hypothetical protein
MTALPRRPAVRFAIVGVLNFPGCKYWAFNAS